MIIFMILDRFLHFPKRYVQYSASISIVPLTCVFLKKLRKVLDFE